MGGRSTGSGVSVEGGCDRGPWPVASMDVLDVFMLVEKYRNGRGEKYPTSPPPLSAFEGTSDRGVCSPSSSTSPFEPSCEGV